MQKVVLSLDRAHTIPMKNLGRYGGKEGKMECSLRGNECENVSHVYGSVQHIAELELAL